MAEKLDKTSLDFETQCSDKDLTYAVLRELQTHGKKHKLEKFEIPGGVTMVKEIWDPESGLVTAAFKLKRRPLQVSKPPKNSCRKKYMTTEFLKNSNQKIFLYLFFSFCRINTKMTSIECMDPLAKLYTYLILHYGK